MRGVALVPTSRFDVLWLDEQFAVDHSTWDEIFYNQVFFPQVARGTFTSPPVVVPTGATRLDVFTLGLDYTLQHNVYDASAAPGSQWLAAWQNLGGSLTSAPVATASAANRIDVFALGADQSMVHRASVGSAWTVWHELGGCFNSAPCVLPAAGNLTFDIFVRGVDFQVYHATWTPNAIPQWSPVGGGGLGAPAAASAPCAVRVPNGIFLFAAGDDGAMWTTVFDGRVWRPWSSLGPARRSPSSPTVDLAHPPAPAVTFASEPVAVAFFPEIAVTRAPGSGIATSDAGGTATPAIADPPQPAPLDPSHVRVDVLAVGVDGGLYHRWLDSTGWHGETTTDASGKVQETGNWARVGASLYCASAPSVIAAGTRTSAMAMPRAGIKAAVPTTAGQAILLTYDGTSWGVAAHGPKCRLPSYFTFSLDSLQIDATRSLHSDTDVIVATLAVGKWPLRTVAPDPPLGDVGTGGYQLFNLSLGPVVVELCEPVVWTYTILNSSQGSSVVGSLLGTVVKGTEDYVNDQLKGALGAPPTTEVLQSLWVEADPSGDISWLTDAGGGATLLGSAAGAAVAVGLEVLLGYLLANCDGVVAAGTVPYQKGRDVQRLFSGMPSPQKYKSTTRFLGGDSSAGCGGNSDYTVFWSITEADPAA